MTEEARHVPDSYRGGKGEGGNGAHAMVKRFNQEFGTGLPNVSIDVISCHTRLHTKTLHRKAQK